MGIASFVFCPTFVKFSVVLENTVEDGIVSKLFWSVENSLAAVLEMTEDSTWPFDTLWVGVEVGVVALRITTDLPLQCARIERGAKQTIL